MPFMKGLSESVGYDELVEETPFEKGESNTQCALCGREFFVYL